MLAALRIKLPTQLTKMAAEPPAKLKCTYCTEDIIGIAIRCVECGDFDLCLQCFSSGAEIGLHKNNHSYKFIDSGTPSTNRGKTKWTAQEHVTLLYQTEKFGFRNWDAILPFIEPRTAEEANHEFVTKFVDGNLGRAMWPAAYKKRDARPDLWKEEPTAPHEISFPPVDISPDDAVLLGYMPNRDDFDQEFDIEEAESLLSSPFLLNTTLDDDKLDMSLKLALVDLYIDKLRERSKRKKIAADYQLINKFFQSERFKTVKTPEQEFGDKLKWLCQIQTAKEHDVLIKSLLRQKQLQQRLSELFKYRKNGLTKIEELPYFEQEVQANKGASGSFTQRCPTAAVNKKRERNEERELYSTGKSSTYHTANRGSSRARGWRQLLDSHPRLSEPSEHLLNKTEAELCSSLKITPSQFISVKALLLANPNEIADTTPEKQIQEYIQSAGWT